MSKAALWLALVLLSAQASALTLYVDPARGNDDNGCGQYDPCRTLKGAHSLLYSLRPNEHVTIRVASGTFRHHGGFVWKYTRPPYSVRIVGSGTVFDGAGYPGTWLTVAPALGKPANLTIAGIGVTRYGTAISVNGSRNDRLNGYVSRVVIDRMAFGLIGGEYTTDKADTFAAVRFVNVRNSRITRSTFRNIENAGRGELLHAVYMAHYSSGNTVAYNYMAYVSGDPIRLRDGSNSNILAGNTFGRTGVTAHASAWLCTGDACTKQTPETASLGNTFKNNSLGSSYAGERLGAVKVFGAGSFFTYGNKE